MDIKQNFLITFIDDHKIGLTILVHFANSSEKETDTSVLKVRKLRHFEPKQIYQIVHGITIDK